MLNGDALNAYPVFKQTVPETHKGGKNESALSNQPAKKVAASKTGRI
jgi:hypothetical protein